MMHLESIEKCFRPRGRNAYLTEIAKFIMDLTGAIRSFLRTRASRLVNPASAAVDRSFGDA